MKRDYWKMVLCFLCLFCFFSACGKEDASPNQSTGGVSQKIDDNGFTEEQRENALERKGKVFGELPVVGEEDDIYCNLPENMRDWSSVVPICRDPLYGILYYVDYGGDSMIHAVFNGESELAVGLLGRQLFCRKGKLYFLLDTQNQIAVDGAKDGNILSYNPVDGTIAVVSDGVFDSIMVYQDVIYCRKEEESSLNNTVDIDYWFYDFETEELVEQEHQETFSYVYSVARYGKYFLTKLYGPYDRSNPVQSIEEFIKNSGVDPSIMSVQVGIELRTLDGEQAALNGLPEELPKGYYVKDGCMIWLDTKGVHYLEIETGKENIIAADFGNIGGLICDGKLYLKDGGYMDLEQGNLEDSLIVTSAGVELNLLGSLYTDGETVYVLEDISADGMMILYRLKREGMQELLDSVSERVRPLYEKKFEQYSGVARLYPVSDTAAE